NFRAHILCRVHLEHPLIGSTQEEHPVTERLALEDVGIDEDTLRHTNILAGVRRRATSHTSHRALWTRSVKHSWCSSSSARNSSSAARRVAALRSRSSSTSSRLKRACEPFLEELIRPSFTHCIKVGLETPSRSAATVLVSDSGNWPMVTDRSEE